jgi:hypothetical protein
MSNTLKTDKQLVIIPQRNWTIVSVEKVLILNNGKYETKFQTIRANSCDSRAIYWRGKPVVYFPVNFSKSAGVSTEILSKVVIRVFIL